MRAAGTPPRSIWEVREEYMKKVMQRVMLAGLLPGVGM